MCFVLPLLFALLSGMPVLAGPPDGIFATASPAKKLAALTALQALTARGQNDALMIGEKPGDNNQRRALQQLSQRAMDNFAERVAIQERSMENMREELQRAQVEQRKRQAQLEALDSQLPKRSPAAKLEGDVMRHGQTLKDQKPEILLENFGPDALEFGVYYWIDLGSGTVGRQVASDLRFMIEASRRKNGIAIAIAIAFPQRDLHVDMSGPIKVQLEAAPGNSGRE